MKKFKKIFAVLTISLMIISASFALTACDGGGNGGGSASIDQECCS